MSFVIFNTETNKPYMKSRLAGTEVYPTERGAKISASRMNNKAGRLVYTVWEISKYRTWIGLEPVKMKKVRNLMTGVEIEIPEDTPRSCDPSTELYWSM